MNDHNKIIVMVAVLDKRGSTNIAMAKSFMKFGFQVIPINYRTVIAEKGEDFFYNMLYLIIKESKPFMTVFCKCNGIDPKIIDVCRKHTKTWLFNPDPQPTIEQHPEIIEHAKRANFSSCTGVDVTGWFADQGVQNCYHIIQGIDQDVFKPVEPKEFYKADISFIGTKNPERDKYKKLLEDNGFKVKFYGSGYTVNEVVEGEFAEVCASSKFMLSINSYSNLHKEYFSNRLTRYLACGSCVLHLDDTGTLHKYFEGGKDIFYFSHEWEILDLLKTITDEVAYRTAMNGRTKILNFLTWDHVIARMLSIASTITINRPALRGLANKKGLIGVEIGVYRGENVYNLLSNLDIGKLYLIDLHSDEKIMNDAHSLLKPFEDKIVWIRKSSTDAVIDIPNELDFVYIDGSHTLEGASKDIQLYFPKVKVGGIIGGHDYDEPTDGNGVREAVGLFFKDKKILSDVDPQDRRTHDWWTIA